MSSFLDRVKVIATSAVTWLTLAAAAIPRIADEIADEVPTQYADDVVRWGGSAAGWLLAAVAIIRIVTPVAKNLRGITPQPLDGDQLTAMIAARRYLERNPNLTADDLVAASLALANQQPGGNP